MTREQAYRIRKLIELAVKSLEDGDALDCAVLFPHWKADTRYEVQDRIFYGDVLYRVVQTHTSQSDWTPDITPAIYVEVPKPGEIPVWKRPTGAHDAYNVGDKVWYPDKEGKVYESLINANTYSPEEYPQGWDEVAEN